MWVQCPVLDATIVVGFCHGKRSLGLEVICCFFRRILDQWGDVEDLAGDTSSRFTHSGIKDVASNWIGHVVNVVGDKIGNVRKDKHKKDGVSPNLCK